MNWEIEDCLIRLENQMYGIGSGRSALRDKESVIEYIRELEQEIDNLNNLALETGEYIE
jgi:hypothetical protein